MKKRFISLIVVGSIVAAFGLTYGGIAAVNAITNSSLQKYIETFDPVEYDEETRLRPSTDSDGHISFTTDGEFKVMHITDVHIGGGAFSAKKDKKTVFELCSMLQKEKPDLVVLGGDNGYAVPGPIWGGGGTFNNKFAASDICDLFDHMGVYFTTVFGNHDTEAFDYYDRVQIGKYYEDYDSKYCLFKSEFSDTESKRPSVSNQIIKIKNTAGKVTKNLLMIDTNDYIDNTIRASIKWQYDTLHDAEVDWARSAIEAIDTENGEKTQTLTFLHIPLGEYEEAYRELEANNWADTTNTKYIEGVWDEKVDDTMGGRIWYGGCQHTDESPASQDKFFEEMGPDGLNTLQAIFCGHDHVNNAVVEYKGVTLSYGYSVDNEAYSGIKYSGLQRGATVIKVENDGTWTQEHKNAYKDYNISTNEFVEVYLDHYLYEGAAPSATPAE